MKKLLFLIISFTILISTDSLGQGGWIDKGPYLEQNLELPSFDKYYISNDLNNFYTFKKYEDKTSLISKTVIYYGNLNTGQVYDSLIVNRGLFLNIFLSSDNKTFCLNYFFSTYDPKNVHKSFGIIDIQKKRYLTLDTLLASELIPFNTYMQMNNFGFNNLDYNYNEDNLYFSTFSDGYYAQANGPNNINTYSFYNGFTGIAKMRQTTKSSKIYDGNAVISKAYNGNNLYMSDYYRYGEGGSGHSNGQPYSWQNNTMTSRLVSLDTSNFKAKVLKQDDKKVFSKVFFLKEKNQLLVRQDTTFYFYDLVKEDYVDSITNVNFPNLVLNTMDNKYLVFYKNNFINYYDISKRIISDSVYCPIIPTSIKLLQNDKYLLVESGIVKLLLYKSIYYLKDSVKTENDNFTLYPNPTQNILNINFSGALNQSVFFIVFDLSGKILSENTIKSVTNSYSLRTENFSPGLYFIKINDEIKSFMKW